MSRFAAVLLLLYLAFTGASTACAALALPHSCPMDGGETCTHESDCPSDPCQQAHRQLTAERRTAPVPAALPARAPVLPVPDIDGDRSLPATPAPPADVAVPETLPLLC